MPKGQGLVHPGQTAGLLASGSAPGDRRRFLPARGGSARPSQPGTNSSPAVGDNPGGWPEQVSPQTLRTAPHLPWLSGLLLENLRHGDADIRAWTALPHLVLPSFFLVLLPKA